MKIKKIEKIISKYLINQATLSELKELESWLENSENKKEFTAFVKTNYLIDYNLMKFDKTNTKELLNNLIQKEEKVFKLRRIKRLMRYAALFILLLTTTFFVFKDSVSRKPQTEINSIVNSIEPGVDKAILTLENGSQIELEKESVIKTKRAIIEGAKIVYNSDEEAEAKVAYNYLAIPRGGQFFIELSDKTKVWLNSDSKLKYPVNFKEGETRKVELLYGEAYFDVSPSQENNNTKFVVLSRDQEVEVLGTEFNIKAYNDERNVYTTLVEGLVEVGNEVTSKKLFPNQQSIMDVKKGKLIINSNVNVYDQISWKDGVFSFNGKSLKEIMKVISRWYDVEVEFKNKGVEDIKFIGIFRKNQGIEQILTTIKNTHSINSYNIKENKIILK